MGLAKGAESRSASADVLLRSILRPIVWVFLTAKIVRATQYHVRVSPAAAHENYSGNGDSECLTSR